MVKKLKNYCATVGNGILFSLIFFLLLCSKSTHAQSRTIETTGDVLLFTLPATALTTSLIIKDYEGTWQFAKSALLNQAVTIGLKYATGKSRPNNNGERAFPSGHTSTTFQSAAFIQKRYGWKYGIPAYALAGFTGYNEKNIHDYSYFN